MRKLAAPFLALAVVGCGAHQRAGSPADACVSRWNGSRLTPLEVACGRALDVEVDTPPLPDVDCDPLTALERACLPALERPPCVVSFSGGLDSSVVLAAAGRAARRAGLAEPIPVTHRFT